MDAQAMDDFKRTQLYRSIESHEYVWLPSDPAFSSSPLAYSVQEKVYRLVMGQDVIMGQDFLRDQHTQRMRSNSFRFLMKAYPDVAAQNPHAGREMRAVFGAFGTKKVKRQFKGLVALTDKHLETKASRAASLSR